MVSIMKLKIKSRISFESVRREDLGYGSNLSVCAGNVDFGTESVVR